MGIVNSFLPQTECTICGELKNKIFIQQIYDGYICKDCLKKVNCTDNPRNLSIKVAAQRVNLYNTLKQRRALSYMPPYPYISVESYEMSIRREKYIHTSRYRALSDAYYDNLTRIDNTWSIIYNEKDFNGPKAQNFEKLCLQHIEIFKYIYYEFCVPYNTIEFNCVPAFKRLSMLYEKQKRYVEATYVCIDAIKHGAPNEYGDGDSGKMYARLARMAKKANMIENPEVKSLLI